MSDPTRRDLLASGGGIAAMTVLLPGGSSSALATDYASSREALDDLDRLASLSEARLTAVRQARSDAGLLTSRFLATLRKQRETRDDVRVHLSLPKGADPGSDGDVVDDDLPGLRQALDDLMIA